MMHRSGKRNLIRRAVALMLVPSGVNMAALTDLADVPIDFLQTGATSIKHNLMFVLDDSGSMAQDYTPDHVNDSMCYDSKDDNGTITDSLKPCMVGDPLMMSPDFNLQYYNPDIRYDPPKRADHSSYPHANFTAAYPDGFNIQKTGVLRESQAGTVNLSNSWPDRQWCDTSTGGNCVTNTNGYDYPNDTYAYGNGKAGCTNYDTFYGNGSKCLNLNTSSAPYYWRIEPSEYCTDDELTNCGPTFVAGSREIASTLRWCTDATLSNCQARKLTGYNYPRNVGQWVAAVPNFAGAKAKYSITLSNVPKSKPYSGTLTVRLTANNGNIYDFYNGSFSGTTSSSVTQSTRNTAMGTTLNTTLNNLGSFTITHASGVVTIEANSVGAAFDGAFSVVTKPSNVGTWSTSKVVQGKDAITGNSAGRVKHYTMRRYNIDNTANWPNKSNARTDCLGAKCTYDEEKQNFANWYSYYRTRMQAMKSAVSIAFDNIDDKMRVGFNTISYTGTNDGALFLIHKPFDSTFRTNWYSKLFAVSPSSSTPLRTSLKKIGDLYSKQFSANPYDSDANKAKCQRNYTLLTTDGYWNDSFSGVGNQDNNLADPFIGPRSLGRYDGGGSSATDTLADVAAYYYKNDLVPSMPDAVAPHGKQATKITFQNMITHTLGLGVSGVLSYRKDYETAGSGDFKKIADGVAGQCAWSSTCDWPVPISNSQTAVDDLWHAAVNGGGKYFSAKSSADLVSGMQEIVNAIQQDSGSGAAAATSSPNITATDNWLFSTTYSLEPAPVDSWYGQLAGDKLDVVTGLIIANSPDKWTAQAQLQSKTGRVVYTFDSAGSAPRNFNWGALNATEQAYFSNKGSLLTQYPYLTSADQTILNSGSNMVAFIAGNQSNIGTAFRNRTILLGDIVHTRPVYTRLPDMGYIDSGYSAFVSSMTGLNRKGMVYVGANDGMIHAFEGNNGNELWSYIPKMLMPDLYRLAEKSYVTNHRFYVDGEPTVGDAQLSGGWKTLYVTGMGKGGRGFVALDVTDPDNPKALWEFCHSATLCNVADSDVGYSFGNPVITKWSPSGGTTKWVVLLTSGHNNASPGNGGGWLYILDAETGAILSKTATGSGSSTSPSGLSKIAAWADNPYTDNTAKYVYGGDLNGDIWRFDLTAAKSGGTNSPVPVIRLASVLNATGAGQRQPVTTKPELIDCGGYRMVLLGTGKLLGQSDILNKEIQSIYGIVDRGTTLGTAMNPSARNWGLVQQIATPTFTNGTLSSVAASNNAVNPAPGHDNGWYMDFTAGERVNVDPQLGLGTLVIASNNPDGASQPNSCTQAGMSVTWQLAACNGHFLDAQYGDPVAGITLYQLPDGRLMMNRVFGNAGAGGTTNQQQNQVRTGASTAEGKRVSWRELVQ